MSRFEYSKDCLFRSWPPLPGISCQLSLDIVQDTGPVPLRRWEEARGSHEAGDSRSYKSMDFNERESDLVSYKMTMRNHVIMCQP